MPQAVHLHSLGLLVSCVVLAHGPKEAGSSTCLQDGVKCCEPPLQLGPLLRLLVLLRRHSGKPLGRLRSLQRSTAGAWQDGPADHVAANAQIQAGRYVAARRSPPNLRCPCDHSTTQHMLGAKPKPSCLRTVPLQIGLRLAVVPAIAAAEAWYA